MMLNLRVCSLAMDEDGDSDTHAGRYSYRVDWTLEAEVASSWVQGHVRMFGDIIVKDGNLCDDHADHEDHESKFYSIFYFEKSSEECNCLIAPILEVQRLCSVH